MTRNVRHLLAALAIAAAAGTGGFLAGTSAAESADWHTGTARVMGHPDDPEIVARVDGGDDGWDYATTGDIEWIDEDGTHHAGLQWYHPHIHGTTAIQLGKLEGAKVLLGGPEFKMMAPLVYGQFQLGNWPFAAAVAFILMTTTLALTVAAGLATQ